MADSVLTLTKYYIENFPITDQNVQVRRADSDSSIPYRKADGFVIPLENFLFELSTRPCCLSFEGEMRSRKFPEGEEIPPLHF